MSALRSIFEREAEVEVQRGPTARPEGVRVAVKADERAIFDLLMTQAAEESAFAPVNEFKVLEAIKSATERKGGIIGIIDSDDGRIAATIGLIMGWWWYSEEGHYQDLWCFVSPEFRRGRNNYAQRLIQFAKWWGEQAGAPVLMGVASTKRTQGKIRLFARNMPLVGAGFMWRSAR